MQTGRFCRYTHPGVSKYTHSIICKCANICKGVVNPGLFKGENKRIYKCAGVTICKSER